MHTYHVYILSNYARTTFYIGVTSNLGERVNEHKEGRGGLFTAKYNATTLCITKHLMILEELLKGKRI